MHTIRRDGLFYKIAYPGSNTPDKVSLCSLVPRFVFFGLLFAIVGTLLLTVTLVLNGIIFAVRIPWIFIQGKRLEYSNDPFLIGRFDLNRILSDKYHPVPIKRMPSLAGVRIIPLYPLLAGIVGWVGWRFGPLIAQYFVEIGMGWELTCFYYIGMAALAFGLGWMLWWMLYHLTQTEPGQVFAAWFKAKKEKICPILDVVDEE